MALNSHERRRQADRSLYFLAYCSLLLATVAAGLIVFRHAKLIVNWQSAFVTTQTFGQNCRFSIGEHQNSRDFEALRRKPQDLKPVNAPWRASNTVPPLLPSQFIYLKCPVDLSTLPENHFGEINLGPLFGEGAVWLNNSWRAFNADGQVVRVAISDEDKKPSIIETINLSNANGRPGLSSLIPPYVTSDIAQIKRTESLISAYQGELPIFRIGFSFALALIFFTVWIGGLRTPDVAMIICAASFMVLDNFLLTTDGDFIASGEIISPTVFGAVIVSLSLFVGAFFRDRFFSGKSAWMILVGFILISVFSQTLVSQETRYRFQLSEGIYLFAGGLLMSLMLLRRLHTKNNTRPRASRTGETLLAAISGLAAIAYFFQSYYVASTGIGVSALLNLLLFSAFAIILGVDLIKYQSRYLEAKSKIEIQDAQHRAIVQTAQIVAHDVRAPLRIARELCEKLVQQTEHTDAQIHLDEIVRSEKHAEGILKDLLSLGKNETLNLSHLNLTDFIKSYYKVMQQTIFSNRPEINFQISLPEDAVWVKVDEVKLKRILDNILQNAVQALATYQQSSPKTIRLSLVKTPDFCDISVENNGPLISQAHLARLFEPFFTAGKPNGTGLGLALSKKFIELMSGSISVSSQQNSTIFRIQLPAQQSTIRHDRKNGEPSKTLQTIALIDDNIYNLQNWATHLNPLEVLTFGSPQDFITHLESHPEVAAKLDLIISDYYFGSWDTHTGLDLAVIVSDKWQIPFMIMTNSADSLPDSPAVLKVTDKHPKTIDALQSIMNAGKEIP